MKKYVSLFTFCILVSFLSTNAKTNTPDFAYPQTVEKQASADLEKALQTNDGVAALNALIRYSVARDMVSPDNAQSIFDKINEVKQKEKSPVIRSLLDLFLAKLYDEYYENKHNTDNRTNVISDTIPPVDLWSGEMFKSHISQLVSSALENKQALQNAKLSDYKSVITTDKYSSTVFPTLYDFVCEQAVTILSSLDTPNEVLSVSFILDPSKLYHLPPSISPINRKLLMITSDWVNSCRHDSPQGATARFFQFNTVAPFIDVDDRRETLSNILVQLYHEYSATSYCVEFLTAIPGSLAPKYYNLFKSAVEKYPDFPGINSIKTQINIMEEKNMEVEFPQQVFKDIPVEFSFNVKNVAKARAYIYSVPENIPYNEYTCHPKSLAQFKLYKQVDFELNQSVPFDTIVKRQVTFDKYGRYIIVPEIDGKPGNVGDRYYDIVKCTDIRIFNAKLNNQDNIFVVSNVSGAPLKDVTVTQSDTNSKAKISANTDSDGRAEFNTYFNFPLFNAVNGSDRYFTLSFYNYRNSSDKKGMQTKVFASTALPLYHPGDSVDFYLIAYGTDGSRSELLEKGTPVSITVRNANYQVVDTIPLLLDDFGRAAGKFVIPADGLTGYYSLETDKQSYTCRFLVSDYKLPKYVAEITNLEKRVEPTRSIAIEGSALTYSGFPMANADVTVTVNNSDFRFYFVNEQVEVAVLHTTTDDKGIFTLSIDQTTLDALRYPDGRLSFDVTVTAPDGENRFAARSISLGKPYCPVSVSSGMTGDYINVDSPTAVIPVVYRDVNGVYQPLEASITFTNGDKSFTLSAEPSADGYRVATKSIPSGQYNITVTPANPDLANPFDDKLIFYRKNDKFSPSDDIIWAPVTKFTAKAANEKSDLLIFAKDDKTYMLIMEAVAEEIVSRRWVTLNRGANNLSFSAPAPGLTKNILLISVKDGETETINASILTPDLEKELEITVENFRDKTVPLTDETITIRVKDKAGNGQKSAVILDMYSKAIDAIQPRSGWRFSFPSPRVYSFSTDGLESIFSGSQYVSIPNSKNYSDDSSFDLPSFDIYDHWFFSGYSRFTGGVRMYKSAAQYAYADDVALAESSHVAVGYGNIMKNEMVMEDAAVEATAKGALDSGDDASKQSDNFRPSEIPLAFFNPMLTTDENGVLVYTFTMPNANTTWLLDATAFSSLPAAANKQLETVASKPVMVSMNAPRFIRQADRAFIAVSAMNNTDEAARVALTFDVIDAASGKLISSQEVTNMIGAKLSASYSFAVDGGDSSSTLILRAKASSGNYTDGEQIYLPILSADQLVTDANTFYLSINQTEKTIALPQADDATTILTFCENPQWEVVSALPGILAGEQSSSIGASAAIFSAAIAEGILKANPEIAAYLKDCLDASDDEAKLVSALEKNEELKQFVLSQTPWVADAKSETERIARLALLFNQKEIDNTYSKSIATLAKLQNADGGWGWISNYPHSSEFITSQVLQMFGELRQLGYLPTNKQLAGMIDKALKYYDNIVAKQYKKNSKGTWYNYAYVRSLFDDKPSSINSQLAFNQSVNSMIKNWKTFDTTSKAFAALTLYRSGNRNLAKSILGSLRQFAQSSPEQGTWWPSADRSNIWSLNANAAQAVILNAFAIIEPTSAEIDPIRQWLILNKRLQNWGTAVNSSYCIAAILNCGTSWNNKPGNVSVTIDGDPLEVTKLDKLTGAFTTVLPAASRSLQLKRSNDGPAWGAVLSQYVGRMADIAAHSIPELSVTKDIVVRRGDNYITSDSLSIGDVVEIRLIITNSRDMDYVTVCDERAACFEPVIQTPRTVACDGAVFYLENRNDRTNLFIDRLPRGSYIITYEMSVNNAGEYASGVATVQSQYAPEITAHSSGKILNVNN